MANDGRRRAGTKEEEAGTCAAGRWRTESKCGRKESVVSSYIHLLDVSGEPKRSHGGKMRYLKERYLVTLPCLLP